jgi:hypothetical protein
MASSLRDQLSARPRRHALRTELGNNERDRPSRVGGEGHYEPLRRGAGRR